jgi:hypothetical protein
MGGNVGKGSVNTLKNLLVELLALVGLVETSDGPGKAEAPELLEEFKVDLLALAGVLLEAGCQQVDHHSCLDDFWAVHRCDEVLLAEVEDCLLRWVVRARVVERAVFEVLGQKLLDPSAFLGAAWGRGRVPLASVSHPSVEERLPIEISVRDEDDTIAADGGW